MTLRFQDHSGTPNGMGGMGGSGGGGGFGGEGEGGIDALNALLQVYAGAAGGLGLPKIPHSLAHLLTHAPTLPPNHPCVYMTSIISYY